MSKSVFFFIFLFMCGPAAAQTVQDRIVSHGADYEQEILERAAKLQLHEDPYWHTLLHYKWTLTGRKSLVDDPNFFLSSKGKRNPRSELEANLRTLFQPPGEGQKSFSCRFTARYHWLKEKLALDEKKLPVGECAEFTKLVKNIRPESMTLIFPTFHINNPASMFGHTFISIDTATPSKLLSYAVNYSAITGENPGPFYALMGVFGFYRGYFSSLPYYAKVAEYSDFDSRDIWEYPLAFTRDEVVRMMMHVVELDNIYSDYFFFDENCSYNLLFLFDAARPGLKLTDNRGMWVIPVDTMRRAQKNGLIKEVIYRPSRVTRIKHIASLLSRENRDRAIDMVRGGMKVGEAATEKMPDTDKAIVLDLAVEYLKYRYSKGKIEEPEYREILMSLLGARSALGNPEGTDYRIPAPASPLEGHRSNRVMAGAGCHDSDFYTELRYRPSYHSLIDPDEGYLRNGQIIFTDFRLRYYPEDRRVRLQGVD
ncbi:MAG TPA: DUF4105 domain-containing protein, partial [Spirochaetes bacterium]|nr:DUF4105 domain-containing protein [Spirochaetota bacterium]